MAAKRPGDVMIFTVDIVGDRTTEREEFSPSRYWWKPAGRQADL